MNKIDIKGLSFAELQRFVESIGEKRFRAQQIFGWMHGKGINSYDEMTNLSKELRLKLFQTTKISQLQLLKKQESTKDKSIKYLFELEDGLFIESVLMLEGNRATLCVSTQVGCAIDCKFCATGMMGLKRNLTSAEIVDQLLCVQKLADRKVNNVVCMGMGEPFHNYNNLVTACSIMSDESGPNLSKRRIVASTSGLIPKIYQFVDENQRYRLAISLNATTDKIRSQIMPLNRKWPIRELMEAAKYYTEKIKQPVTFEYVLLSGVNDSLADAERLKNLIRGIWCKINLIPYNTTLAGYRRSSEERILQFYGRLASVHAPVTIRWSKGDDIDAGCGQLAGKI